MNMFNREQRLFRFTEEPSGMCLHSEGVLFLLPAGVGPNPMTERVVDDLLILPPKDAQRQFAHLFQHVEKTFGDLQAISSGGVGRRIRS